MNRGKILDAWRRKRASGRRIEGGRSGPDYITVSNEDKLKGARGIAGLLPIGDANGLSLQSARERSLTAAAVPLLAGVCATDPLRLIDKLLEELKELGVAGVQNAPSVGLIDGGFRTNLEDAGLGFAKEVEMIRLARQLDLVTAPLVFSPEDARRMTEAGADVVVIHPGFGNGKPIEAIASAAREARKDVLVFALGSAEMAGTEPGTLDGIQTD